jgi:hypothetical protein
MWERKVPKVNNPKAASLLIPNANGAFCSGGASGPLTCTTPRVWARELSELAVPSECVPQSAQRVLQRLQGPAYRVRDALFRTDSRNYMVIGNVIEIRPELRFDYSYEVPAFDGGRKWGQFTAATDAIFFY